MNPIFKSVLFLIAFSLSGQLFASSVHEDEHGEENIIKISPQMIKENNIEVLVAGEKNIQITRDVLGKIVPNANKTIYIYPRYSGIIKSLTKYLGDYVKKDELLATVESNQTLQIFSIKSPFAGFVVRKEANVGEHIKEGSPIYQIADLSTVWVDLFIYRKNAQLIKKGQKILITQNGHIGNKANSTISYVSPLGIEHNQTMLARAVLPNKTKPIQWLPGLYVDATIIIEEKAVPIAVKSTAIQTLEGKKVIFIQDKNKFEAVECKIGLKGKEFTQILEGISIGQKYAGNNSFLLKAQLEKESASHSH